MKGNFNQIINSDTPVLVDFFAEWCGPCKMMAPILQEVAKELNGQMRIIKIDVDKNPNIAAQFQVRGVPTLAIFKAGKILWKQSGAMDKSSLHSVLRNYL